MINEKEKRSSDYLYLMIEFPSVYINGVQHSVVYFEQNGDEVYQFRAQADIVTVPDPEIRPEVRPDIPDPEVRIIISLCYHVYGKFIDKN